MHARSNIYALAFWLFTLLAFVATATMVFVYTPVETTMAGGNLTARTGPGCFIESLTNSASPDRG